MSKRILLIGCGEIGSRHLQAVASLPEVREIEIVDRRPEALELGRKRVSEVPDSRVTTFRWLSSLDEVSPGGDLCIVATQADVRCRVVRDVADRLDYKSFLLEKVVSQSVLDYQELIRFSDAKQLLVWVNCKTRAHPSHSRVKANLRGGEPFVFTATGGNHGLVTNGIHVADLFAFYDDADSIEGLASRIDPILHQTKRGACDLSGTLCGRSKRDSTLFLSFDAKHSSPVLFSVVSSRYRAVVDDMMKWLYESSEETGWAWRPVPFEADLTISNMSRGFVTDILAHGCCQLPSLKQCFAAHDFILTELQPHFERLLGTPVSHSPVT